MPTQDLQLVGKWEKITTSECSQVYPDAILFQEELYYGQKNPPGSFTLWDVGRYEVIDPHHIQLSTAYDANIRYEFSLSEELLTFRDPQGCEFLYRKVLS